jgi:mercuric ion transport protein
MQWKQYLSVGVAILTCPCHLPLLVAALAGTVLGGWLNQHSLEVALGMAGMFVLAFLYSLKMLTRQETMSESHGQVGKDT